ncbi:MAG TPA: ferrochelatase, partial [Sphingomicrobium sp.]|nr:ferrochelatase [Sphingomicrobium sp.]
MNSPGGIASDVGVLLVNLGTPEGPDPASVRKYLAEFLSDPRVVEIPAPIWKPVLHGVILRTRPAKSAKAYREIWTNEGSPLMAISKRQRDGLQDRFGESVCVGLAMRYGNASIGYALSKMVDHGFTRILIAPLYPQYCAATTASALDAAFAELKSMRSQPAIRTLPPYFEEPLYIDALKASIERQLSALDFEPERL